MKANKVSQPAQLKTEVKERITLQNEGSSPKRCNLTQVRRQRIEFFVHKTVNNVLGFGRVRSPQWLQMLEKFINIPGVDGNVLLNWLDKIPCLKSDKLNTNEFNRKFRSAKSDSRDSGNVSFPETWNEELAKVFQDTKTVLRLLQDDAKANKEHESKAAAENGTESPEKGTTSKSSETNLMRPSCSSETKPMLKKRHSETEPSLPKFSSDIKPYLKRRSSEIKPTLPKLSSETKPKLTKYNMEKRSSNISDNCGDQLSSNSSSSYEEHFPDLILPKFATVPPGYSCIVIPPPPPSPPEFVSFEEIDCDSEPTVEMRQVTLEKMNKSRMKEEVDDDVLKVTPEELLTQAGNSEDDQYSVDSFDELLLPDSEFTPENDKGHVPIPVYEEMPKSILSELEDLAEQDDPRIEIDASKSAQSNEQEYKPNSDTYNQWYTQKRLYFHKLRALCGPNDPETFQAIWDLENRVSDVSLFLQNISFYVNYSTDSLQKIFSSMAATYEDVQK